MHCCQGLLNRTAVALLEVVEVLDGCLVSMGCSEAHIEVEGLEALVCLSG